MDLTSKGDFIADVNNTNDCPMTIPVCGVPPVGRQDVDHTFEMSLPNHCSNTDPRTPTLMIVENCLINCQKIYTDFHQLYFDGKGNKKPGPPFTMTSL